MKSYYAIETPLRYYGFVPVETEVGENESDLFIDGRLELKSDISRWKTMPHKRHANLPVSFGLTRLTSDIGRSDRPSLLAANRPSLEAMDMFIKEYGLLDAQTTSDEEGNTYFRQSAMGFEICQHTLQEAWKGTAQGLKNVRRQVQKKLRVTPIVEAEHVNFMTEQLWPFICMLFLRDYAAGITAICKIPDCPRKPYFLRAREGQIYCSHECAVLANVRRFREFHANKKRKK